MRYDPIGIAGGVRLQWRGLGNMITNHKITNDIKLANDGTDGIYLKSLNGHAYHETNAWLKQTINSSDSSSYNDLKNNEDNHFLLAPAGNAFFLFWGHLPRHQFVVQPSGWADSLHRTRVRPGVVVGSASLTSVSGGAVWPSPNRVRIAGGNAPCVFLLSSR